VFVRTYTAVGAVIPTYDPNGNLTSDGTFTYGYDAENRLTSASGAGNTASYAYDGQGRRKLKTVNGTTTVFVIDADNREVLEYDGASGAILRWYAYGLGSNDVLNQMDIAAATRTTFIPDIQGSIIGSLDSSSGALSKRGYLPYGASASATGTFAYTGQRIDPETNGLYYYRARMYRPAWGRFMQVDPIGYAGGSNLYAYVGNDPLDRLDPTGMATDVPQSFGITPGAAALPSAPLAPARILQSDFAQAAGSEQQLPLILVGDAIPRGLQPLESGGRGGGGLIPIGRSPPPLPEFTPGGKTSGVFQTPTMSIPLQAGVQGPASSIPRGPGSGFDIVTTTHVEGHAAALMRQQGLQEGTLFLNNPVICAPCANLLPRMLPPGSTLNVVLPNGAVVQFRGNAP
jgi:RHS repeat-associated protein